MIPPHFETLISDNYSANLDGEWVKITRLNGGLIIFNEHYSGAAFNLAPIFKVSVRVFHKVIGDRSNACQARG